MPKIACCDAPLYGRQRLRNSEILPKIAVDCFFIPGLSLAMHVEPTRFGIKSPLNSSLMGTVVIVVAHLRLKKTQEDVF